mmetsp:Transcript_85123/g.227065  ORF Transcript_85123/g.227065 Transcript_85123/m.227065 type:complete len:265 (-) Transcript_85123:263-1057(-)
MSFCGADPHKPPSILPNCAYRTRMGSRGDTCLRLCACSPKVLRWPRMVASPPPRLRDPFHARHDTLLHLQPREPALPPHAGPRQGGGGPAPQHRRGQRQVRQAAVRRQGVPRGVRRGRRVVLVPTLLQGPLLHHARGLHHLVHLLVHLLRPHLHLPPHPGGAVQYALRGPVLGRHARRRRRDPQRLHRRRPRGHPRARPSALHGRPLRNLRRHRSHGALLRRLGPVPRHQHGAQGRHQRRLLRPRPLRRRDLPHNAPGVRNGAG